MAQPLTLIVLIALVASLAQGCSEATTPEVVVYTSVDQVISEPILLDYQSTTKVRVRPVFDLEAVKTTGLATRLIAEAAHPKADVFWSSEIVQTIALAREGIFDPYTSPSAKDIPSRFRQADGLWTGFGCRARVLLVNTQRMTPGTWPHRLADLTSDKFGPGDIGFANPLFGTSRAHAAALYAALGPLKARQFFLALTDRGARMLDGNALVRDLVAHGELEAGIVDTDDAHEAIERGAPVAMIVPDQEDGGLGAFVTANSVALVRGAPNPDEGRRLIDHLLSPAVEATLARSGALEMPTRKSVPMPGDAEQLATIRAMTVPYAAVAAMLAQATSELRDALIR